MVTGRPGSSSKVVATLKRKGLKRYFFWTIFWKDSTESSKITWCLQNGKRHAELFVVYRSKIQVLRTGCYSPFSLPSSVHLSVVACDSHRIFPLDEIVVKLEWVKSIKDENFKISPAHKLKLPPAISEYIPDIILSLFDNKTCRILSLSPPSPQ